MRPCCDCQWINGHWYHLTGGILFNPHDDAYVASMNNDLMNGWQANDPYWKNGVL